MEHAGHEPMTLSLQHWMISDDCMALHTRSHLHAVHAFDMLHKSHKPKKMKQNGGDMEHSEVTARAHAHAFDVSVPMSFTPPARTNRIPTTTRMTMDMRTLGPSS